MRTKTNYTQLRHTERIITINRDMEKGEVLNFTIQYIKGELIVKDEDGNRPEGLSQTMVRYYDREKKPKYIAKATNLDYMTDQVGSWLMNFDYVFAIDTNMNKSKDDDYYYAVTIVYGGIPEKPTGPNDYKGQFVAEHLLTLDWYSRIEQKLEPIAWCKIIKKLVTKIPSDKRVGIVIDSELNKLDGFNDRTIPVYKDWYLPQGYTMINATADKKDDWCNKMIHACDKAASHRLGELNGHPSYEGVPDEIRSRELFGVPVFEVREYFDW